MWNASIDRKRAPLRTSTRITIGRVVVFEYARGAIWVRQASIVIENVTMLVLPKQQSEVETLYDLDDNFISLRQAREPSKINIWIDAQLTVDMV